MDERLAIYPNKRKISRLRRENLNEVALAIVAVVRGQCSVTRTTHYGTPVVEFSVPSVLYVVVLASDWDRLSPYITQGYFNPLVVPCSPQKGYFHPEVQQSFSLLGLTDTSFFNYVLGILRREFIETFPTSTL